MRTFCRDILYYRFGSKMEIMSVRLSEGGSSCRLSGRLVRFLYRPRCEQNFEKLFHNLIKKESVPQFPGVLKRNHIHPVLDLVKSVDML